DVGWVTPVAPAGPSEQLFQEAPQLTPSGESMLGMLPLLLRPYLQLFSAVSAVILEQPVFRISRRKLRAMAHEQLRAADPADYPLRDELFSDHLFETSVRTLEALRFFEHRKDRSENREAKDTLDVAFLRDTELRRLNLFVQRELSVMKRGGDNVEQ